jgi:putative Ca2+/H+ antiporter (TMEM165/GDT1 family)
MRVSKHFATSPLLVSTCFILILLSLFAQPVFSENLYDDDVNYQVSVEMKGQKKSAESVLSVKKRDADEKNAGMLAKILDKNEKKKKDHDREDQEDDSRERNGEEKKVAEMIKTNFNFIHAFFASLSVIVVSEIGDKTFFIAAIMAMKHPRFTVFSGAIFALGLMTLLSALLGNILTKFLPKKYTYYASSFLFALFGLKMLKEGYEMSSTDASEEYEEANTTLKESEEKNSLDKDVETGLAGQDESKNTRSFLFVTRRYAIMLRKYISAVFLQAFILTFLAEWGDRSQISTIILAARENMVNLLLYHLF